MNFKITFEGRVGVYDARMSRQGILDWLASRGLRGMTSASSGAATPLDQLDDAQLAQALSAATIDMLKELATRKGSIIIKNDPDDEVGSWTSVLAESIEAVKVAPYEEEHEEDNSDVGDEQSHGPAFREADSQWLSDLMEGFGESEEEA